MQNKPIHSSTQLIDKAIAIANDGRIKKIVVAAAQDADVLDAVVQAKADNFIEPILVGDRDKIIALSDNHQIDVTDIEILDKPDISESAHTAIQLASEGKADAVMKGFLPTSLLLKTLLDSKYGLRGNPILSHCAVMDIPGYHKLLNLTDGGMMVHPDTQQKKEIANNAILVSKALMLSPIKIAVSSAYDKIYHSQEQVKEDHEILIPYISKNYKDIIAQSPIPFDTAVSKKLQELRSNENDVDGDADIFLASSIEECNIIAKSLIHFAHAVFAGVIVGAKVPVSLVSRSDTVRNKKASLALSCVLADYYKMNNIWGDTNA